MNPAVIAKGIFNRIQADTGTGGLWSGAAPNPAVINYIGYLFANPASNSMPYMVFFIELDGDNAFSGNTARYSLRFEIYDNAAQGADKIEAIIDRIMGDAMLSTGSRVAPTYGFDRHNLVLPTNTQRATGGDIVWKSSTLGPANENYLLGTVTFEGQVSNSAVNP